MKAEHFWRTAFLFCLLTTLFFISACAPSTSGEDSAASDPPENLSALVNLNWVSSMGKTAAYDSVTGNIGLPNCLETVDSSSGWTLDAGTLTQSTSFQMIEDKKSLYDKLSVGYSASLNSRVYSQSAEYKMTNEVQLDTNSIWALLEIEINGPIVKRVSNRMSSSYFNRSAAIDSAAFRDTCGDLALTRIRTGAKYYGLLKITTKNLTEMNSIKVGMKQRASAAGVSFTTKKDFANEFSLQEDSFSVTSYIYTTGGLTAGVVQSVDGLTSNATNWLNDMYTIFQGSSHDRVDLWNSGSRAASFTANKINDLVSNNAVSADFIPYSQADWGTTPESARPPVLTGLARMGQMGTAYLATQTALDNLEAVVTAPELYVASRSPLTLFGATPPARYPMLQQPSSTPGYQVDSPSEGLARINDAITVISNSKEQILEAAKICTGADDRILELSDMCEAACTDDLFHIVDDTAQSGEACRTDCNGAKRCDIAYKYFLHEPTLDVVEIERDLLGNPRGLPLRISYRTSRNDAYTDVALPERRSTMPLTCPDYKTEVGGATLTDGEYIFYYDGNPLRPLYLYCRNMDTSAPTTWLTLPNAASADPSVANNLPEPSHRAFDTLHNYASSKVGDLWYGRAYQKYKVMQTEGYLMLVEDPLYSVPIYGGVGIFLKASSLFGTAASFDLDLRGTPLEISHSQQFLGGGFTGSVSPSYLWGMTRVSSTTDPTDQTGRHANRVIQRMRAAVEGAVTYVYPIQFASFPAGSNLNDGNHQLVGDHAQGPLRLDYIDRSIQPNVHTNGAQEQTLTNVPERSNQGDKIISFDDVTLP